MDPDGTSYVGGPALTMRFHTNTDSVTLAVLADRLGRLGAAATEDELDAAFVPKELTATATPTAAQVMDSGLCQEPDQPQPDPGKKPHAGREHERGRGHVGRRRS